MSEEQKRLLEVAKGCRSYGGGHRDWDRYEAFQHGINTVIRALEEAIKNDKNTQVLAIQQFGSESDE